jgi:hypothetical protein
VLRSTLATLFAGATLLVGTSPPAAPLLTATWTQTLQGVSLIVTNAGATCTSEGPNLVQQVVRCPATGLGATGASNATDYTVSLTMGAFALNQFTTGGAININTIASLGPGDQVINGTHSAANATMGIPGNVTVKVAAHVGKGANLSKLAAGATTLVLVPLSIGKAGSFTGFFYAVTSPHYVTVDFYAWTPHTLRFTGLTTKGVGLPDAVAMGSFDYVDYPEKIPASHTVTGPFGSLTVTLVAPTRISIDGPLFQRRTVSFTTLKLNYLNETGVVHGTPEPGALLLLAAGMAGLLLARRHA